MLLTGTFLGGLGLFLLGVSMLTEGLSLAAGNSLRDMLQRSTRTIRRGMLSGFALTALVQSSSAVTIATIGFVNAGLLGLNQALAVVLGSSVGTTATGWLVAFLGLQLQLGNFALPMVGLGMLLRLFGHTRKTGAMGEALVGLGLVFIGIDFLRTAFADTSLSLDLAAMAGSGMLGIVLFVLAGIVFTVMTQSSSATIAITLTAVSGDVIPFAGAAAMIVGATIGTTSTSALAVIGATANARRVAAGHLIINAINACCGLLLLPILIWLLESGQLPAAMPVVVILVVYHSVFNLLGVSLQSLVLDRLSGFLARRFRSEIEDISRPEFLDKNVLASPALALNAFLLELQRMAELSRSYSSRVFLVEKGAAAELRAVHDSLRQLVQVVEQHLAALEKVRLSTETVNCLPLILRVANYLDEAAALSHEFQSQEPELKFLHKTAVHEQVLSYRDAVLQHISRCDSLHTGFSVAELEESYQLLRGQWRNLKSELLQAGVAGQFPVVKLNRVIDTLRNQLRVAERLTRSASRLDELSAAITTTASVDAQGASA
ncbi:MAG: Na/Pi symporter [Pseudomonadales bacterium]|nr:Na/Pi symporter [Pseudomonadales bacterium]